MSAILAKSVMGFHMLFAKHSSEHGPVETLEVGLSMIGTSKQTRLASTADMKVPAEHVCGLESCPSRHRQRVWIHNKKRIRITGNRATGPEKRQYLNHSSQYSGVVGVSSGTWESKMSLGVMTGPNITSFLPRGDRAMAPHPAQVSPFTTRVPPPSE